MDTNRELEMEIVKEDDIILRHTHDFLQNSSFNKKTFAEDKLVPALVKSGFYSPEPSVVNEYVKWLDSKRRVISRIIDGRDNFPLSWKWVWLSCLPDGYRKAAERELWAMHNSLYIPLPNTTLDRIPQKSNLFVLTKEFADVQMNSGPAQDGMYDVRDCPKEVQKLADDILELQEACLCELKRIEMGTGVVPSRIDIFRHKLID